MGSPGSLAGLNQVEVIRIGPFELQRLGGSAPSQADRRAPSGRGDLPSRCTGALQPAIADVTLEFLNGPSRSTCWPMNRVMSLIGSAGGCKFRLADPSVAPFHCSLLRSPVGLWVVDLLGPDGIGVNDALVRYALLADNDVLKVGRYRIRIRSRFPGRDPDAAREQSSPLRAPGDHGRHSHSDAPGLPVDHPRDCRFSGGRAGCMAGIVISSNLVLSPSLAGFADRMDPTCIINRFGRAGPFRQWGPG